MTEDVLTLVILAVVMALGFRLLFWFAAKHRQRLKDRFAEAAAVLGGHYHPGTEKGADSLPPTVTLEREGVRVHADTHIVGHGKSATLFTRVRCGWALGRGPALNVRETHLFHGIGKAFGMQDLVLGEPEFDEAYVVSGPDPVTVRRLVDGDARRSLATTLVGWAIETDAITVVLQRKYHPESAAEVVAAIELAHAVATRDRRILSHLAESPDARAADDGTSVLFERSGVRGQLRWDSTLALVVEQATEGPDLAVSCAEPGVMDMLPEGTFAPELALDLSQLGQATLTRSGRVHRVRWPEVPEPAQVDAAWKVLVALAAPSTRVGAFR